tara:strand:+ start:316 stop:924 length:609 start_codon:yes stop_codon:yes gene_type:complete
MPAGKLVKIGVWENNKFIGCVLYGRGANNNISKTYNLSNTQVAELVRVALNKHIAPVSQIVSIANKILKRTNRGLRLLISYADPQQKHNGSIYQAMNWIYVGMPKQTKGAHYIVNGKQMHGRSVRSKWGKESNIPYKWEYATNTEKHKYLYPLDKKMRKQIEILAKPYPKHMRSSDSRTRATSLGVTVRLRSDRSSIKVLQI